MQTFKPFFENFFVSYDQLGKKINNLSFFMEENITPNESIQNNDLTLTYYFSNG